MSNSQAKIRKNLGEESKLPSTLQPFAFAAIKAKVMDNLHDLKKFRAKPNDAPLLYLVTQRIWMVLRATGYNDQPQNFHNIGFKIHINLADLNQIPDAWNAILPVLIKYQEQLLNSKALMFDLYEKKINKLIKAILAEPVQRPYYALNIDDGIMYECEEIEKTKRVNLVVAAYNRYVKGANIVLHFFQPGAEANYEDAQLKLYENIFQELEEALKAANIKAGPTPDSDFPVRDYRHLSARVDRDEAGKYFDFSERDKFDFAQHPMLQKFVSAECLTRKKPQDHKHVLKETAPNKDKKDNQSEEEKSALPFKTHQPTRTPKADVRAKFAAIFNVKNLPYWKQVMTEFPALSREIGTFLVAEHKNTPKLLVFFNLIKSIQDQVTAAPKKFMVFKNKCAPIATAYQAMTELLNGNLSGLQKLEVLQAEIDAYNAKHQPQFLVEKKF